MRMVHKTLLYVLLISVLLLQNVIAGDDDEEEEMCPCILFNFIEDSKDCPDVENKNYIMKLKMNKEEGKEDEPDMMKMNGFLELKQDIEVGMEMYLEAVRETEQGNERMMSCAADFCQSMQDEDAPWACIYKYFNTSSCPVSKNKYYIKDLFMDLSFAKGVLTHDYCGVYSIKILIQKGIDKIFCIILGAEIYEARVPCSQCPSMGG